MILNMVTWTITGMLDASDGDLPATLYGVH
jgi:hypothetical protein